MDSGARSFEVVELRKPGQKTDVRHFDSKTKLINGTPGRFVNSGPNAPRSAASKAFTQACTHKDIRGVCTLIVKIKETTRGSDTHGKTYTYKCKRHKRTKPVVVSGQELWYYNDLKSMNTNKKLTLKKKNNRKLTIKKKN